MGTGSEIKVCLHFSCTQDIELQEMLQIITTICRTVDVIAIWILLKLALSKQFNSIFMFLVYCQKVYIVYCI